MPATLLTVATTENALIVHVLSFIPPTEIRSLSCVSKQFQAVLNDDVWCMLFDFFYKKTDCTPDSDEDILKLNRPLRAASIGRSI